MAVTVTCPACDNSVAIGENLLGSKMRCKRCQEVFVASAAMAGVAKNGGGNGSQSAPRKAAKPAVKGKSKTPLFVGAGAGLVAMAGVMAWALFLKDGDTAKTPTEPAQSAKAPSSTKLNLNDAPPADDSAPVVKVKQAPSETPTTPVAATKPAKMIAGFSESPRSLPPALSKDTLDKVKRSAVQIRTMSADSGGEGSGWFAEPGIILTNAHVANMLDAAAPPPFSMRVFLYRGTKDEREVSGTLLAVDRENDLAVVRVKGGDLPEPFPIAPSSEIADGTQLHVVGFPLGTAMARDLTMGEGLSNQATTTLSVRNTNVAGRVTVKGGGVRYVQLEGGADHGNSGGAIVDNAGYVRCVLDAGLPGTNMRFGIPSEFAVYLLQGRVTKILPGQAYKASGTTKQPFVATVVDPLKRIKTITIEMWPGDRSVAVRPASDSRPSSLPGDGARTETKLIYDSEQQTKLGEGRTGIGEIDLAPVREGQVYWMQPKYERIDGSTRWGEAMIADFSGLPVDKIPAKLACKHESGREMFVSIKSEFGQGFAREGAGVHVPTQSWHVKLKEKIRQVHPDGSAGVQWEYLEKNSIDVNDEDAKDFVAEQMKEFSKIASGMKIEATLTNRGLVKSPKSNLAEVPLRYRRLMERINSQIIQSIEAMAMAMPDKDVSPGDTWSIDIPYKLFILKDKLNDISEDVVYRLGFKYVGTRTRNGSEEAVVIIDGRITKGSGGTAGEATISNKAPDEIDENAERQKGVWGFTHGSALFDLKKGVTTLGKTSSSVFINFNMKRTIKDEDGREEVKEIGVVFGASGETALHRSSKEGEPMPNPSEFLPDQPMITNPFVGVADQNMAINTGGNSNDGSSSSAMTGTAPLDMPKEVLDRVKKQACMIQVKSDDGGSSGSGWLAEPGIVVTNAHVVGMVERAARPPKSVHCVFESGTQTAKIIPSKILLVDHDNDLCVLKLESTEGLPEPLTIVPSTDLIESQRLYTLGFPMGKRISDIASDGMNSLSTQLKVRNTSVNGRVENHRTGLLKYIRVEGGLTSGNSGGALVDMNGAVRCVAVAIYTRSDKHVISLCIPSEYAQRLLWGFPLEVNPKFPYQAGSVGKLPVEVKFGDPMRRVKKVWLDYWTGTPQYATMPDSPGPVPVPRRASVTKPKPRPDDSAVQSVECEYDAEKMLAKGEFALPDVDPGFAYWIQPRYIDQTGQEKWGEAIFYKPDGPPVERRKIKLQPKFVKNSARMVTVESDAQYRYVYLGQDSGHAQSLSASLGEQVLGIDPQTKLQAVEYQFDKVRFGRPRTRGEYLTLLLAGIESPEYLQTQLRTLVMRAGFTSDGMLTKAIVDATRVANPVRGLVYQQFATQVIEAVQLMSIKFPNKEVAYGESWEQPLNLHIETKKRHEAALYKLKLTYLGVRDRGGRSEAVVEIKGSIANDEKGESIELKTGDNAEPPPDAEPGDPKQSFSLLSLFQTPKPKDPPKGGGQKPTPPKQQPKGKDKDKDADKEEEPAKAGTRKPLYGIVRGYAFIDIESGVVSTCQMFIDVDTEIVIKDEQKNDVPVKAGGTIELRLHRHASDK